MGVERIAVALNFNSEPGDIRLAEGGSEPVLLPGYLGREGEEPLAELPLRSNEGIVVLLPRPD